MSPNISKGKRKMAGKKCWVCKSYYHLKMNCPKLHCFYCGKSGHIKANCWIKKMCYIFSKLKEKEDQKDKRKEKKQKNKESKKTKKKGTRNNTPKSPIHGHIFKERSKREGGILR